MDASSLFPEFVLEGEDSRWQGRAPGCHAALRGGSGREFTEALKRITDLNQLEELLKLAISARRLSQFRKGLSPN
jgi:hypothetical protein